MSSDSESNEENVWVLNVFGTEKYKTGTELMGTEVGRTAEEVIEKWKKAKNEELEKRIFKGYVYEIDDNCTCHMYGNGCDCYEFFHEKFTEELNSLDDDDFTESEKPDVDLEYECQIGNTTLNFQLTEHSL